MSASAVDRAAAVLLEARHTRGWLATLPEDCRPRSLAESYKIQGLVLARLGPIGAWKVGAPRPDSEPACAAIAAATVFESGVQLDAAMFNLIGVEAELAYRITRDLPPRSAEYSLAEVSAAIGSVHPAIEISDTRFVTWASQDRFSHVADQLNHGALVIGHGRADWQAITPATQHTILSIDDRLTKEVVGGNPGGDPLRLLLWLANIGAQPFGGLRAGHIVTTGSVSGVDFRDGPLSARVSMPGLGEVTARIGYVG
jgi:2-keto-4-pentenoate hydratase